MAAIADLIKRVLTSAPGCPAPVAEEYLLLAAIDFCRATKAWTSAMDAVDLESTDFPYTITPVSDAVVDKVLSVVVDGEAPGLAETTVRDAELTTADWRTETGDPAAFINMPAGTVTTVYLPDASMSFQFTVAYAPAEDATTLPDDLVTDWIDPIISRAIALLAIIPNKPWTSIDMFNVHSQLYKDGVADAKVDLNRHYVMPLMATAPSPI